MVEARATAETHSTKAIVTATFVALAVAIVILFVAVLPAEYGIDPLRTGALLGLTDISKSAEPAAGARPAPVQAGVYVAQAKLYKVDSEDLGLAPGESVEIKYHMQKGAAMIYAWKATGPVQFEFHGEPDQKPRPDYFESYQLEKAAGQDHSYGSFAAPTTGIHGWFWENKGKNNVQIHLTTSGFYDSAKMYAGGPPEDMPVGDVK